VAELHIEDEFTVACRPAEVFAFMVDPAKLASWQTIKTEVTPLTDGPPRLGYRVLEGNRIGPRRWKQVVEFTEFDPGRAFAVRVVEGPPSRGRWAFTADDTGTLVRFAASFEAPALLAPLARAVTRRQFGKYHRELRAQLEQA
jgi:hypothetical protein